MMLKKFLKLGLCGACLTAALSGCTVDSMRIEEFADDASRFGCYVEYVTPSAYDYEAFYGDPDAIWMDCGRGCDGFFFYDYRHSRVWASDVYRDYLRYFDEWRIDHNCVEQNYTNSNYFECTVQGKFYSIRRVDDTILFFSGSPSCGSVVDDLTYYTRYDYIN